MWKAFKRVQWIEQWKTSWNESKFELWIGFNAKIKSIKWLDWKWINWFILKVKHGNWNNQFTKHNTTVNETNLKTEQKLCWLKTGTKNPIDLKIIHVSHVLSGLGLFFYSQIVFPFVNSYLESLRVNKSAVKKPGKESNKFDPLISVWRHSSE